MYVSVKPPCGLEVENTDCVFSRLLKKSIVITHFNYSTAPRALLSALLLSHDSLQNCTDSQWLLEIRF